MKDTDKVTLTVGQLKKLVKESKSTKVLKESLFEEKEILSKLESEVYDAHSLVKEIEKHDRYVSTGREYSKTENEVDQMYIDYREAISNIHKLINELDQVIKFY